MGMFSSKTKITVGTSVSRVVKDDDLPETISASVISAIFEGRTISNVILENLLNGPVPKFDRMYTYGKDTYTHGLPNAKFSSDKAGRAEVKAAIESEVGQTVVIDELFTDSIDNVFIGWKTIHESYGYDSYSNELTVLSAQKGFPVYLDTLVTVHSADRSTNYSNSSQNSKAGYTPERVAQKPGTSLGSLQLPDDYTLGVEEGVTLHTIYENAEGTLVREWITISLGGYDLSDSYFHAKYHYGSTVGYWVYKDDSGTYPDVDAVHNARYTTPGSYFPFVFFRHHDVNRTATSLHDTEEYKTTKAMLDIIGMDYQEIGESIHENPDIDDVEQATLMFAVPLDSGNDLDRRYLFDFFSRLSDQTREAENAFGGVTYEIGEGTPKNNHNLTIQDADFKFTLSYGRITKRMFAGKLGAVGDHFAFTEHFIHKQTVTTENSDGDEVTTVKEFSIPQRVFKRQVTRGIYEEVRVNSPRMVYVVYQKNGGSRVYDVTIDETDYGKLLIPLDKSLLNSYTIIERETIYFRSLHLVFNAKVEQKIEWYETGVFQSILLVAAIAITIYSLGSGAAAIGAALAVGTTAALTSLALATLVVILKGLIVSFLFKLAIEELDLEEAFWVTVVLAVVAVATGQFQAFATLADDLLIVASSITSAYAARVDADMKELVGDGEDTEVRHEELSEDLQELKDLLDTDTLLDPFVFIGQAPLEIPGEHPEDLFRRTIGSGNIGTLAFEELENYVDNSLRLPEFADTIDGDFL